MQYDAIIIGGSFAGLAAATYLARARRRILVVDAGLPRNRFAAASHGFLSQDGKPPGAILAKAREQLAAYPTVDFVRGEAVAALRNNRGFDVHLTDGSKYACAKLLLAFGLSDTLPNLPGVTERWGTSVLHCPYCHGIEFSDRPLGVLYKSPMSVHQAAMIREWGPTTLFLNGATLEQAAGEQLAHRGVSIEPAPVIGLEGPGVELAAVQLSDGRAVPIAALYIVPTSRLNSPLAEQLGCAVDEEMMGPMVRTGADGMSTVAGVYAAGDIARQPHSIAWAVSEGVTAGTSLHRSLVFPELAG